MTFSDGSGLTLLEGVEKLTSNDHSVTLSPVSGTGIVDLSVSGGGGGVSSVSGTLNRITSTGGTTPVIDISASYVGQNSITTLGTIGAGTWGASFGAVSGANLTHITAANIDAGTAGINISGNAATVSTISGLISQGANVTITGSGTSGSPYVIASSGGGSGGISQSTFNIIG